MIGLVWVGVGFDHSYFLGLLGLGLYLLYAALGLFISDISKEGFSLVNSRENFFHIPHVNYENLTRNSKNYETHTIPPICLLSLFVFWLLKIVFSNSSQCTAKME